MDTERMGLMEQDTLARQQALIEGILLAVGEEGISDAQLMDVLALPQEEFQGVLSLLQEKYDSASSGMEMSHFGGRYRLLSKAMVEPYLKVLFQEEQQAKLSSAALETLAIIAYKQPITRIEIEEIRGVSADVMLRKLQAKDLIKEVGRSDALGKPILYSTTDHFMDAFQLEDLGELPSLPQYEKEAGDLFDEKNEA